MLVTHRVQKLHIQFNSVIRDLEEVTDSTITKQVKSGKFCPCATTQAQACLPGNGSSRKEALSESVPWLEKWTTNSILDSILRGTARTLKRIFSLSLAPVRYCLGTASSLDTPIPTPPRKDMGKLNLAWQRDLKLVRVGDVSLGEEAEGLGLAHTEKEVGPG